MRAWGTLKHLLLSLFNLWEIPVRYVFGRDIFISYSRADAGKYAPNLALALQAKQPKLSFYLDKWIAPPDNKLPRSLKRHLKWSSILVLVCTENAIKSHFVREEIRSFARLGRHIVPINVDGSFARFKDDEELWRRISGASPEDEDLAAIVAGRASERIIERVLESVKFTAQDQRLRRAVAATLAFLLFSIGMAVIVSWARISTANAKAALALSQQRTAETARDAANAKRTEAELASEAANQKTKDAQDLQIVAEGKAADAEKERGKAERLMLQARDLEERARQNAAEQERIANSRRLAGLADRNLIEKPDLSFLLSAASYNSPDVQPTFEAKRSLLTVLNSYENLDFMLRHDQSYVTGFAVTPDMRTVITCSQNGKVIFWDIATKKSRSVHEVSGSVIRMVITPNGKTLITSSEGKLVVWDVDSEKRRGSVDPGPGPQSERYDYLAIHPDNKTLVSTGKRGELVFWDISDVDHPREDHRLKVGSNKPSEDFGALCLTFSGDGHVLLAGGSAAGHAAIRRWNVGDLTKPQAMNDEKFDLNEREITNLVYSPNNRYFVSIDNSANVLLWNAASLEHIPFPITKSIGYYEPVFNASGSELVMGSWNDGELIVFNVDNVWKRTFAAQWIGGYKRGVTRAAFSRDGKFIISGNADGTIAFWRTTGHGKLVEEVSEATNQVTATAFTSDGRWLAHGDATGAIRLTEMSAPFQTTPLTKVHDAAILSIDVDTLHATMVSGGDDGRLVLWTHDAATGWMPQDFPVGNVPHVRSRLHRSLGFDTTNPFRMISLVHFIDQGKSLVTIGPGPFVVFWDVKTRRITRAPIPLPEPDTQTNNMSASGGAISADGNILALGYSDGTVRILNTRNRNTTWQTLTGHDSEVKAVAFNHSGTSLVSTDDDGIVIMWRLGPMPQECRRFQPALDYPEANEVSEIEGVAFGKDDRTLAIGSEGAITLWDVSATATIGSLQLGDEKVGHNLLFAPVGDRIAAGGETGVMLVRVDAKSWADAAAAVANREISQQEREFFESQRKSTCRATLQGKASARH
jgi:WD40 repeat protein